MDMFPEYQQVLSLPTPPIELFAQPKHPYTRMLLDAVPDLDLTGRQRKPVEGEVPNPVDPPPGCPFHPRCFMARPNCAVDVPALREIKPGHWSACHYAEEVS